MKTLINVISAALIAMALGLPAWAGTPDVPLQVDTANKVASPALQACPSPGQPFNLSQISQTDCCKGHKGVCGCRAGKIVCCDGTASPNCTCHGDSGLEN